MFFLAVSAIKINAYAYLRPTGSGINKFYEMNNGDVIHELQILAAHPNPTPESRCLLKSVPL
ncbi:hypothetical protein [Segetibacter aerophilus]|uniref:Uncharacterized protein n=1 Tax=Segetibacter aerophilus TaxID=670293 RepID=A0A512B8N9_9BACT|nr:hypothetical protein [Segetibacter aerophilus]GEO08326.1 hypothetical protein SAE01_08220 [Segetibacter aerophilus]